MTIGEKLNYLRTIKLLKSMDDEQLLELFNDIDDIATLHRIAANSALAFEKYLRAEIQPINANTEHKQADDAQRYRDYKSDKQRPY